MARFRLPAGTAAISSDGPQPYATYVDETGAVWVSDWGANAILRFDPKTEKFVSFPCPIVMPACDGLRPHGRSLGCRVRRR
jgi:streptogramin lyase